MPQIHSITPLEVHQLLKERNAYLLDVREGAEHRSDFIDGAKSIPLSGIEAKHLEEYDGHAKKVILHCKSGKRSEAACQKILEGARFDLYTMDGGILEWENLGLPVSRGSSRVLPLDRQVQLVVSSMILIGLTLSMWVSVYGLLLPLIAGLGLLNAALTGWCGMGLLLAKMPWNK